MKDLFGGFDEESPPATATAAAIKTLTEVVPATPTTQKRGRGRPPGSKNAAGANRPLYFDIETIPDESRLELFGLEPLPETPPLTPYADLPLVDSFLALDLKAAAKFLASVNPGDAWFDLVIATENAKEKPRKGLSDIIDDRTSRLTAIADAAAERQKLLSTCPEFLKIISLAMASGDDEPEWLVDGIATRGKEPESERSILEAFWFSVRTHATVVGFHVLAFDLPAIFIRSALLGVEPTKKFDLAPWKSDVIDLAHARFPKGSPGEDKTGRPGKLKSLARVYGIEIPAGDDDGSKVAELYETDPARVGRYNASDVVITREIHKLYQGFFCA